MVHRMVGLGPSAADDRHVSRAHKRPGHLGLRQQAGVPPAVTKTLEELVAGDQVVVSAGIDNTWLDTLVKVTKTQIVLSRDARFNRNSGYRCGEASSGYGGRSYIKPATPEAIEKVRRRKVISHLTGLRREALEKLSTDALNQMYKLSTAKEQWSRCFA